MNAPSLLLVEDEGALALTLEEVLSESGYDVRLALDGGTALKELEGSQSKFDVLVTDIRLPVADGWTLARRAREANPAISVIYISGQSATEHPIQGVPNSAILSKPFTHEALLSAVAQANDNGDLPSPRDLERTIIHIVDQDSRRRASLAREFLSRGLHAEIYDGVGEFADGAPKDGFVFAADDADPSNPSDLVSAMRTQQRILPVAFYSAQPSPEKIVAAMLLGGLDYLQWPFDSRLLDASLLRLATLGRRHSERDQRSLEAKAKVATLSPRERQVLEAVMTGHSSNDIALNLGLSVRTVEIHRANMLRKLDAASSADAVRLASYAGVDPELI